MFRKYFLEEEAGGTSAGASTTTTGGAAQSITSSGGGAPAGSGGNGAGTPPSNGAGTTSTTTTTSWMDALPDEIKRDPSIQLFKESGVGGLAKSWVSAQAMLGKDKVVIPGEKATDEEWAAFHSKLGRPESADKYEFKLPEGQKLDDAFAKGFKEQAFKNGLSPKAVQSMVEWYAKEVGSTVERSTQAVQLQAKQAIDAYRDSLGGNEKYMARVDMARTALRAVNDPKMMAFLDKDIPGVGKLGSQPEIIEHFAKLAGMMGEDKLRDGTGLPFSADNDPAAIQKAIMDAESALRSRLDSLPAYERMAQVEAISKLYERLEAARQPRQ